MTTTAPTSANKREIIRGLGRGVWDRYTCGYEFTEKEGREGFFQEFVTENICNIWPIQELSCFLEGEDIVIGDYPELHKECITFICDQYTLLWKLLLSKERTKVALDKIGKLLDIDAIEILEEALMDY